MTSLVKAYAHGLFVSGHFNGDPHVPCRGLFSLGRMVSFHQLRVSTAKVAKSGLENLGSRTSTFVCRTIGANLSVALQ